MPSVNVLCLKWLASGFLLSIFTRRRDGNSDGSNICANREFLMISGSDKYLPLPLLYDPSKIGILSPEPSISLVVKSITSNLLDS